MEKTSVEITFCSKYGSSRLFQKVRECKSFLHFCNLQWECGFFTCDGSGHYIDDYSDITISVDDEVVFEGRIIDLPKKCFFRYKTIRPNQAGHETLREEYWVYDEYQFDIDGEFDINKLKIALVNWRGSKEVFTGIVKYDDKEIICDHSYSEGGLSNSEARCYFTVDGDADFIAYSDSDIKDRVNFDKYKEDAFECERLVLYFEKQIEEKYGKNE